MSRFPIHRSSQLTEFGVYLKTVAFRTSTPSERYAFSHTDDYYFFGFIEDGQCRLNIYFEEYTFGLSSVRDKYTVSSTLSIFPQSSWLSTRYWWIRRKNERLRDTVALKYNYPTYRNRNYYYHFLTAN